VAKEYKLSEVMAMLENGHTGTFENLDTKTRLNLDKDLPTFICCAKSCNGEWTYNFDSDDFWSNYEITDKWTLVRTPVTWQEALQVLRDGGRVQCKNSKGRTHYYNGNNLEGSVAMNCILSGTWYKDED